MGSLFEPFYTAECSIFQEVMQFSVTILLGMMFVAALVRGKPKTYLVETADDGVGTAGGNDYQLEEDAAWTYGDDYMFRFRYCVITDACYRPGLMVRTRVSDEEDGADDNDSDNDNDNDNDNKYYVNNNDIHDDIHYDPMYTDKDGKTRIG